MDDSWFLARWFGYLWDWFEKTFGFILGDILAGILCVVLGFFAVWLFFRLEAWYEEWVDTL